eukprot:COSAG06_NODE_5462_length_3466_cov_2.305019_4_plen_178_part_00
MGFKRDVSQGAEALILQRDDPGMLWLGKSALEVAQQSSAYQHAKAEIERVEAIAMEQTAFKRAMEGAVPSTVMWRDAAHVRRGLTLFVGGACLCPPAASKSTADAEEMRRREAWAEKVPPEPDGSMQASQVKVLMGDHKVTRRFGSGARAGQHCAARHGGVDRAASSCDTVPTKHSL